MAQSNQLLRLSWPSMLLLLSLLFKSTLAQGAPGLGKPADVGCDLYLAESSIPNAGLGVYAARDYDLGETIGEPSIGIPLTDLLFNATDATEYNKYGALPEFLWETQNIGGYGEAIHVELFLPGIASLVNHHAALENVIGSSLKLDRDLHRDANTMAGSFTAYHGFTLIAKRPIKAGEELFADKVSNSQIVQHGYMRNLSSAEGYKAVDGIIASLHMDDLNDLTDAQWVDALYRLKTEVMSGTHHRSVIDVFPSSLAELQRAWEVGTARVPLRERTLEWIQNNGQCLDGIKEGKSTIENAGSGAFATKKFRRGSTVSVSPLVQIPDSKLFNISNSRGGNSRQLLYNYCYGHRKASLLLCPTTHAAMINHDANKANVEMRWVRKLGIPDLTVGPIEGLEVDSEDIASYNTRLQLEFVATKEISEGDEIFLNYGKEWEDALLEHINHGTSSSDENNYTSAKQLAWMPVEAYSGDEPIEQQSHFYECNSYPLSQNVKEPNWEELSTNRNTDIRNWPIEFLAWYKDNDFAAWFPCRVVKVNKELKLYDAELLQKPLGINKSVIRRYRNIPQDRIRLVDGLYQSDQHLSWAFRHYIPIDDSIFPLRWRNDYLDAISLHLGKESNTKGTAQLEEDYEKSLRGVKCGLYLAKSNIPNAGFGLYTAVDIPAQGMVIGSKLTVVPAFQHNRLGWPGNDYVWNGETFALGHEGGSLPFSFLAGLFGALANAHTGITNMLMHSGRTNHLLDRSSDPGAGAFSPYSDYNFQSKYPVGAGEELFVSYGEHWFLQREAFRDVPMKFNFNEADGMLAAIWAMHLLEGAEIQSAAVSGLLKVIREEIVTEDRHRTRTALGAILTLDDLAHVVHRNGTAAATVQAKSAEWLDENGFCLDHIYVEQSTIQQAGNGAFSRRAVKEGSVIISSPAIAAIRELMSLNVTDNLDVHNTQIMINYHFGHKDSSVMFFPLNQAVNINHASFRKRDGRTPNARVKFSERDIKSRYILSRTLDDIKKEKYSAMVLDFVATRDIKPDEEILIDYGKAWEDAWDKHVSEWSSPCRRKAFGSCTNSSRFVALMNVDKFNKEYHAWSDEHFTACRVEQNFAKNLTNYVFLEETASKETDLPSVSSYKGIDVNHEGFELARATRGKERLPCVILSASKSKNEFNIVRFASTRKQRGLLKVEDLPADQLLFLERPMKSDIFYKQAFRHEILIPDESFPKLWRDLEES